MFWTGPKTSFHFWSSHFELRPKPSILSKTIWTSQTQCLSVLDFWNVNLGVYYKLEKKNRFRIKLDFFSSSNLIFTACVACKNQVRTRQKIEFVSKLIFFQVWNWKEIKWHSIFQKSSGDRQGEFSGNLNWFLTLIRPYHHLKKLLQSLPKRVVTDNQNYKWPSIALYVKLQCIEVWNQRFVNPRKEKATATST